MRQTPRFATVVAIGKGSPRSFYITTRSPLLPRRNTSPDAAAIEPAEIATMTRGYDRGRREDWDKWFEAAGYEGSPSGVMMEYENRARMLDLALSGHGAVLCDLIVARPEIASGHLVQIHPTTIRTDRGMWVVFPETATPDPRVLRFRDWLRADLGIEDP